jgi:hypothetical protein
MACSQTICDMTPETLEEPRRPDGLNEPVKLAIFNDEVREYVKDKKSFKGQLNSAYGLILGQYTPSMKCAIESHRDYEAFRKNGDPIALLKAIQEISYGCKSHQYLPLQLYEAKRKLFFYPKKEANLYKTITKGSKHSLTSFRVLVEALTEKTLSVGHKGRTLLIHTRPLKTNKGMLHRHPVRHLNLLHSYPAQIKINMDKCLMTLKMTK